MKILIVALIALAPTSVLAQSQGVPTGIDVRGCARYVLTPSGRIVCTGWKTNSISTGNPQSDVNTTGG